MSDTTVLQQRISQGLLALGLPEQPQNLYEPVRYMLQIGGKRIRPLLTLMAAELFSIRELSSAIPAALAIELFHNFSLVHDDIMDNAPLRRGQQTVHEKWSPSVAILSGDSLLVMAYAQLTKCPADKLPILLDTFNQTALEVCEGQQFDMDFEQDTTVEISGYLQMIRLKTSVLLGAALKMGAILADADEQDAERIYHFGVDVGMAFQLQDDILDVYGDPLHFGKQQGGDILANKKTYLLVKAFENADGASRLELDHWLGVHDQHEAKINAVTSLYDRLGVRADAEAAKQDYIQRAYKALDTIDREEAYKQPLRLLAKNLLDRAY